MQKSKSEVLIHVKHSHKLITNLLLHHILYKHFISVLSTAQMNQLIPKSLIPTEMAGVDKGRGKQTASHHSILKIGKLREVRDSTGICILLIRRPKV